MSTPAMMAEHLGKEYRLYDSPRDRLLALISGRTRHRSHWALHDVSFELHRGQCMGVIGDNGAGKSSLLKLIVGTLQPTQGRVVRPGRLTAILELGAGFHPDFTGRQNLYFGGSLIGIGAQEMAHLEEEILAFSELGVAIDRPVKTYSSGMVVRLAFALVTAVEPDVLVIDEALAVGDQHFQKKCSDRIRAFRDNGCTILFCSHSMYHVRQLCDVALWLDAGRIRALGETNMVLGAYEMHVRQRDGATNMRDGDAGLLPVESEISMRGDSKPSGGASIVSVSIADLGEGDPPLLKSPDLIITVIARGNGGERPNIGVMLEQAHGAGITSVTTHADGAELLAVESGMWAATLTFPELPLHTGNYVISAYLFDAQGLIVYDEWLHNKHFSFIYPSLTPGMVRLPHHWS